MYCSSESRFKPSCMFGGVLQCGTSYKNPTKIVCDLHLDTVFGLRHIKDKVVGLVNSTESTYTKLTVSRSLGSENVVLPFPFQLLDAVNVPAIGANLHNRFQPDDYTSNNKKLCVSQDISNTVNSYLYNGQAHKLYPQEKIDIIRDIIIFWISGGTVANCTNEFNSAMFTEFYTRCRNGLISYWKNYEASLYITIQNNPFYLNFEISKMPIFYQAMLQNTELSNTIHINAAPLGIVPNTIFNLDMNAIQIFNGQERGLLVSCANCTFSTALVILGTYRVQGRGPFIPYTRPPPANMDNNFISAPSRCR